MYQTNYIGLAKPPLSVETNLVIAQKQQQAKQQYTKEQNNNYNEDFYDQSKGHWQYASPRQLA
jgi:hypothetical protein